MRRRSIILPIAVLADHDASGPPASCRQRAICTAYHARACRTTRSFGTGSARLMIARLPAQRRTIAQTRSVLLRRIRDELRHPRGEPVARRYPLTKPLASNSSSPTHRTVNVPWIRYPRPLGPETTNARMR